MKKIFAAFVLMFAVLTGFAMAQDGRLAETPMTRFLADHYKVDPVVVLSLQQRMNKYEDDTSVALYLAKLADIDPMKMLDPRLSGKSWKQLMDDSDLEVKLLFIDLPKEAAKNERFAYIYSQIEKNKNTKNFSPVLYDANIRDLIQLRLLKEAFGIAPSAAIKKLAKGSSFTEIIEQSMPEKYLEDSVSPTVDNYKVPVKKSDANTLPRIEAPRVRAIVIPKGGYEAGEVNTIRSAKPGTEAIPNR